MRKRLGAKQALELRAQFLGRRAWQRLQRRTDIGAHWDAAQAECHLD